MLVRFYDANITYRASLTAPLGQIVPTLAGTFVAPSGRTGVLPGQLGNVQPAIAGIFTPSAGRTGQVASTLDSLGSAVSGTSAVPGGLATSFSWEPPTQNADGSAINLGEITGYEVGLRQGGSAGTYPIGPFAVDGAFTSADLIANIQPPLASGTYIAAVRAVGPINGPWSAEVTFSV